MSISAVPILTVHNVFKHFGAVKALHDVSMRVSRGRIHGLLGKNGAGKSTLSNVIAGLVRPDAGRIEFDGQDVTGLSLKMRKRAGFYMLSQHPEIFEDLSVGENLLLPASPRGVAGLVSWRELYRQAQSILDEHGFAISSKTRAGDLGIGGRRRLSIVRAIAADARLIILDEPTAGLAARDRADLLSTVETLTERGVSFIYISHHNDEVRQLCSEFTVLRDGNVVASGESERLSASGLAKLVTGEAVREFKRGEQPQAAGAPRVHIRDLACEGLQPTTIELAAGEIVGLIGDLGEGPQELLRCLGGLHEQQAGEVLIDEKAASIRTPKRALASGIAYLTQDRIHEGLVAPMSVAENLSLGNWPIGPLGEIKSQVLRRRAEQVRASLGVVMANPAQAVDGLSGGNQQKILFARLLERRPALLLLHEPTIGVDVAAKEQIHQLIDAATRQGTSILVVAQDPDEMARLVDRALIFVKGGIADELRGSALNVDTVTSRRGVALPKTGTNSL